MRDFNFFSPYIENKRIKDIKFAYVGVIALLIVSLVGGTFFFTGKRINNLNNEINILKDYIGSQEVVTKVAEVEEKQRRVRIMRDYYSTLEEVNLDLNKVTIINTSLLDYISSSIPRNIFVKNMAVTLEGIQLQGISENRIAIAELEHNFKKLDIFSSIHVSRINRESEGTDNYVFALIATFKDVKNHENE